MNCIRLVDVWYHYTAEEKEKHWALKGIDVAIDWGEYVAIMGRNGSGKSTLIRLINGLLQPTRGQIWIDDQTPTDEKELWGIRTKIGMVFQNPENQTVAPIVQDDIAFGLENLGLPRSQMRLRIQESLQLVGLEGMEQYETAHLSGGQKQLLAIASVLAMKPKVILFDEATSMLDPQGRKAVLQVIDQLHQEGTTIISVTHSIQEAMRADRMVILDHGQVQCNQATHAIGTLVDRLPKWGLEIPLELDLRSRLIKKGLPLQPDKNLVDELWRLLPNS